MRIMTVTAGLGMGGGDLGRSSTEDRCTDIKVRVQLRKQAKDRGRHEKEGEETRTLKT